MITAEYFHRQAEACIRLARAIKDERIAAKLIEMAEDFAARASELETVPQERGVAWV